MARRTQLTYTPAAGYVGPDVFTFVANDGLNDSNKASVSITVVSNKPTAGDSSGSTKFNRPVAITLTAADPRNLPLTFAIVSGPAHGSLSGTAPNLIFTPALDYVGPDTFTYQVSNGQSTSAVASVSIAVDIGTAPVATSQSIAAVINLPKPVVLNAVDADEHSLTYRVVALPQHGMLSGTSRI